MSTEHADMGFSDVLVEGPFLSAVLQEIDELPEKIDPWTMQMIGMSKEQFNQIHSPGLPQKLQGYIAWRTAIGDERFVPPTEE